MTRQSQVDKVRLFSDQHPCFMDWHVIKELALAIFLGLVQGVTEFLPISSTAHLRLTSEFLVGKDIGLSASNIIQTGALVAIVQYFWSDLKGLYDHIVKVFTNKQELAQCWHNIRSWWQGKTDFQDESEADLDILIAQVVLATWPIVVFALLMRQQVEWLRENILYIAFFLIAGGVLITLSEIVHKIRFSSPKTVKMAPWEVLVIGCCQCLSVFPGISRSGATLSGALFLGRDRPTSVRFSFLLSIPALGLAGIYDLVKVVKEFLSSDQIFLWPTAQTWSLDYIHLSLVSLIVGFVVAYVVGLVCLRWLLKYLATNNALIFIVYRLVLASVIILSVIF